MSKLNNTVTTITHTYHDNGKTRTIAIYDSKGKLKEWGGHNEDGKLIEHYLYEDNGSKLYSYRLFEYTDGKVTTEVYIGPDHSAFWPRRWAAMTASRTVYDTNGNPTLQTIKEARVRGWYRQRVNRNTAMLYAKELLGDKIIVRAE